MSTQNHVSQHSSTSRRENCNHFNPVPTQLRSETIINHNRNCHRQHDKYFPCISKELRAKWLVNLTNTEIPMDVLNIACLGKNFGVPITTKEKIPIERIIASIESGMNFIDDDDRANEARVMCSDVVKNFLRDFDTRKPSPHHKELLRKIEIAFKFKKSHPDILFLKADKGNVTVVVEKKFYIAKMLDILNDISTYRVIKNNLTKSILSYVNKMVRLWYEKSYISERERFKLSCTNCCNAYAYGLPKIHKNNTPFRIIVSFIGTPTYSLAKYLQAILVSSLKFMLDQSSNNKFSIKNSSSLVEIIRNLKLPSDFIMISMDVVSLFTNVPLNLVTRGIKKRWDIIKNNTKIPRESFIEAVTLCFSASAFVFNGSLYQQVFGAAMGSPLSPIVADIVMQDLEDSCLEKLDFPIYFYTRYVDDILVFLPGDKVETILSAFNNYHHRLQFTIELEKNCRINYLELTLIRYLDRIEIDWYHKPTASGRYLNYHSYHPKSQKIGVIHILVDKAILLCDAHFRNKNLAFVRQSLIENGYPVKLVKCAINSRRIFLFFNRMHTRDENNNKIIINNLPKSEIMKNIICTPYVKGLSESLRFVLKKFFIHLQFNNCNNNLSLLYTGHKDSLSILNKSHMVYSIPCSQCDFIFVNHSKYQLGMIIETHKLCLKYPHYTHLSSSLTEHAFDNYHNFNFDRVKILAIERIPKKRSMLSEIFLIKLQKVLPDENDNMSKIYLPLLDEKS